MLLNVTFEYVADGSAEREISEEEGDKPLTPSSTMFLFQMLLTSA